VHALTTTIDKLDPRRLHVRDDDALGSGMDAFSDAASTLFTACPSQMTVDIVGVTSTGPSLVAVLNELARRAAVLGKSLALEVPDEIPEWLESASLSPAIRLERTSAMPVSTKKAHAASPSVHTTDGVARREGRGYVASYGDGRPCAARGCRTTLSRYNSDALCSLHSPDGGRRRD
jgi:hypothetical protein